MKTTWVSRFRRFYNPNSLRYQLLSRSLFILTALLLLIGSFQYVLMHEFIYKNKAESMKNAITTLRPETWLQFGNYPPKNSNNNNQDRRLPPFFIPGSAIAFIDENGIYTAQPSFSDNKFTDNQTPPMLSKQQYLDALLQKPGRNKHIIHVENGVEQLVVLQPVFIRNRLIGVVQVSTDTKPLKEIINRQLLTFLALSITALFLGLLTFLPVLRKTLVPLSNLADAVGRIDAGNLAERFSTQQGQLEIDRLSVSFNGMLQRLELSFELEKEAKEQMRRFIADASHELRTPLTSIHGFIEVLLRGAANNPEQLQIALRSMHGESERINKLVFDLLLLTKLDRTPYIQLIEGSLETVIRDMDTQLRMLAGTRKVVFKLSSTMRCKYDTDKMKQVILNLFHNAVQHTDPEKGVITISLMSASKPISTSPSTSTLASISIGVQLSIQDNGVGIGEQHIPYVFDRFYRSDSSRTRKYGGSGLGLSITKSIVEGHGGTINLESSEGHGCVFHIWLPALSVYNTEDQLRRTT